MSRIDSLYYDISPETVADRVSRAYDEARARLQLRTLRVQSYEDYISVLADGVNQMLSHAGGGRLTSSLAKSKAEQIVARRYGGRIQMAYRDAHSGTDGGLRTQLDLVCDELRKEAIDAYITDCINRYASPVDLDSQEELVRQLFERLKPIIGSTASDIHFDRPGFYANRVADIVRLYSNALGNITRGF